MVSVPRQVVVSTIGGSSTARRRRFSSAVPSSVASSTPQRAWSSRDTWAHIGPTSTPNPVHTPGGTRRWIGAAWAGNGCRTRLRSGMINGATSGHGPLGSKPANASIARRCRAGSIGPPSGRISQSPCLRRDAPLPDPPPLPDRRARRSALAALAACCVFVAFMPGILTTERLAAAYPRLHARLRVRDRSDEAVHDHLDHLSRPTTVDVDDEIGDRFEHAARARPRRAGSRRATSRRFAAPCPIRLARGASPAGPAARRRARHRASAPEGPDRSRSSRRRRR